MMEEKELVELVLDTIERDRPGFGVKALTEAQSVIQNDDLLRFYFQMYIDNCDVSAGYRTAAWDMAVTVMFPPESDEYFDGDVVEAKARELVDWSRAEDNDILFLHAEHSLAVMINAYCRSEWAGRPEIAYGMLAMARSCSCRMKRSDAERALADAFADPDD